MYDSVDPSQIPPGGDFVAGYIDGRYAWAPEQIAAVAATGRQFVSIAAVGNVDAVADVADCESGNYTPQTVATWVHNRRAAGGTPTVYTSLDNWPNVLAALATIGEPVPNWWAAHYTGAEHLEPGSIATQWQSTTGYDISAVADYWPGVDPPQETGEDQMTITFDAQGNPHIVAIGPGNHLLHFAKAGAAPWTVDDVTAELEKTNPGSGPYTVTG